MRWMAPELFDVVRTGPEDAQPTYPGDVYALSMVVMELFTGNFPYAPHKNDTAIMMKVLKGVRPERPKDALQLGLSPAVWNLTEMCWNADPEKRPTAPVVLGYLQQVHPGITALTRLLELDSNSKSKEAIFLLRFALDLEDDILSHLDDDDALKLINVLDQASFFNPDFLSQIF